MASVGQIVKTLWGKCAWATSDSLLGVTANRALSHPGPQTLVL
jgi:hypothetical protein